MAVIPKPIAGFLPKLMPDLMKGPLLLVVLMVSVRADLLVCWTCPVNHRPPRPETLRRANPVSRTQVATIYADEFIAACSARSEVLFDLVRTQ